MTGHHDTKPGEKTRQSDKRLEEHESVLDSPEHIEGVEKTATRQSHQKKKSAEECESVLSGSECMEPEKQTKAERRQGLTDRHGATRAGSFSDPRFGVVTAEAER